MKRLLLLLLFPLTTVQAQKIWELNDFESCILTQDIHPDYVTFNSSGKKIAFTVTEKGKSEIYYLNLIDIRMQKYIDGVNKASYIVNDTKDNVYHSVYIDTNISFSDPEWAPSGNEILTIGNGCEEDQCGTFPYILDPVQKKKKKLEKLKDIEQVTWLTSFQIIYRQTNSSTLMKYDVNTEIIDTFYTCDTTFNHFKSHNGKVYLSNNKHIIEVSKQGKKLTTFNVNIQPTTAIRFNKVYLTYVSSNSKAEVYDLNNGTKRPLMVLGEDKFIALSRDEKFVVAISRAYNGITITRIN